MKTIVSIEAIDSHRTADEDVEQAATDQQQTGASQSLDCLAQAICTDASSDSMQYVLRSDTGVDGE